MPLKARSAISFAALASVLTLVGASCNLESLRPSVSTSTVAPAKTIGTTLYKNDVIGLSFEYASAWGGIAETHSSSGTFDLSFSEHPGAHIFIFTDESARTDASKPKQSFGADLDLAQPEDVIADKLRAQGFDALRVQRGITSTRRFVEFTEVREFDGTKKFAISYALPHVDQAKKWNMLAVQELDQYDEARRNSLSPHDVLIGDFAQTESQWLDLFAHFFVDDHAVQVYRDDKSGFQVSVPQEWTRTTELGSAVFRAADPDGTFVQNGHAEDTSFLTVSIVKSDKTIDQILQTYTAPGAEFADIAQLPISKQKIDGKDGLVIRPYATAISDGFGTRAAAIVQQAAGKYVVLQAKSFQSPEQFLDGQFDKILQSFRIL